MERKWWKRTSWTVIFDTNWQKTEEMIEIGTTLNLHQFRTLLDVYSNLLSTLSIAFYKGEKTFIIRDLTDGIYASAVSGYLCLDVHEFYIDKMTGNPMPTRKGVSCNINEVITLQDILEAIDILNKWCHLCYLLNSLWPIL